MISIETFFHDPYGIQSYLVWDNESSQALSIDIGGNVPPILSFLEKNKLTLEDVFHTHPFLEYLQGQPALRDVLDITAHMNPVDEFWLAHLDTQATILGTDMPQAYVDQQIFPEDVVQVGSLEVRALDTPGNTPGGVSFYLPEIQSVFVGDVLVAGAMGPTDVPHGSEDRLRRAIQEQIFTLPDETIIYPGRGPATTVKAEKRGNSLKSRPYASKY